MMAAAVLSFATLAVVQTVAAGARQTADSLRAVRAMELCSALMEEIVSLNYYDDLGSVTPGPDTGETTRAKYDNSDDFHGFSENAGAVYDAAGNLYPAPYQVFKRSVTASYTTFTSTGLNVTYNGLRVTVTVTDKAGQSWSLTRFIAEPPP
jgi:hypothetical protein